MGEGTIGFMPLGLAVLRQRGVVAWMDVESRVLERAVGGPMTSVEGKGSEPTPISARSELVSLLASTALLVATGGQR